MIAPASALDGLKRQRPEWAPWLAVVEEILCEIGSRRWDGAVPLVSNAALRQTSVPLLAGTALSVEMRAIRRLVKRLIRVAALGGTPKMGTLEAALNPEVDVLTLFTASLRQENDRVKEVAALCGADPEALQAVAALVPLPFLQACHRQWGSSLAESWVHGYCPVCGSWPAFAEVRGIERSRYFRCGRCGGAWHAEMLSCPYCSIRDHNELVALVPEKAGSHAVIEACKRCLGYVKTFTRLQGCPPAAVMLDDLASVDLDVAALDQGYTRPSDAGYRLDVTVTGRDAPRRFFAWNA